MESFGTRLAAVTAQRGRLCVGVDPHPQVLEQWGLDVDVDGLERCARTMVEAAAPQVAVIKPQSAFFEAFGSRGIAVLERVLSDCREAGALTLLDVKRGDIGSTMAAYARAYLDDGSPLASDAITVSPFLGLASLDPALELAGRTGRGVFVLARTSNPGGEQVQLAHQAGRSVGQQVVDAIAGANRGTAAGSYGIVYGLTHERLELDLSALNGPILVPGMGAQGGGPSDVRRLFAAASAATLPSTSRDVMSGGPHEVADRVAAVAAQLAAELDALGR